MYTSDGQNHYIDKWDLLIAHPPCTYLSNAGACRLYPRKGELDMERYRKGLEAKAFFLAFLNADIPHIAVENPVSSKVFEMPEHTQEIQPYQFGHPYTKKTRLWLRNLPPLSPTNIVEPVSPYVPSGTGRKDKSKSGLNVKHDITSEGVIDSGYTGSICVKLYNHGQNAYEVNKGDKVSQLVIMPIITPALEIVECLDSTERGDGGFGSTGK